MPQQSSVKVFSVASGLYDFGQWYCSWVLLISHTSYLTFPSVNHFTLFRDKYIYIRELLRPSCWSVNRKTSYLNWNSVGREILLRVQLKLCMWVCLFEWGCFGDACAATSWRTDLSPLSPLVFTAVFTSIWSRFNGNFFFFRTFFFPRNLLQFGWKILSFVIHVPSAVGPVCVGYVLFLII